MGQVASESDALYWIARLAVFRRYRNVWVAADKCSVVGVEENLQRMDTVNARSGRVHSISHIRPPTID